MSIFGQILQTFTLCYCLLITRGVLKYRSFLLIEHSVNHLFLKDSLCFEKERENNESQVKQK